MTGIIIIVKPTTTTITQNNHTAVNPQAAWELVIMNSSVKTTELAKFMRVGRALRAAKETHTCSKYKMLIHAAGKLELSEKAALLSSSLPYSLSC